MGLPKLSMLASYWISFDLNCRHMMRKILWAIKAFVVACYLPVLFNDTFFLWKKRFCVVVFGRWRVLCFLCTDPFHPEFLVRPDVLSGCLCDSFTLPIWKYLKASNEVTFTLILGALTIISSVVRFICLKVGTGQENLICELSRNETSNNLTNIPPCSSRNLVSRGRPMILCVWSIHLLSLRTHSSFSAHQVSR